MRNLTIGIGLVLLLAAGVATAAPKEIKTYCKELKGQKVVLKVDVAQIDYSIGGADATDILSDGTVQYSGTCGFDKVTASSTDELSEHVDRLARSSRMGKETSVRVLPKGSKAEIRKVQFVRNEIWVDLRTPEKDKFRVRLHPGKKNSLDEVCQLISHLIDPAAKAGGTDAEESS